MVLFRFEYNVSYDLKERLCYDLRFCDSKPRVSVCGVNRFILLFVFRRV
jgi:hypothetical protein